MVMLIFALRRWYRVIFIVPLPFVAKSNQSNGKLSLSLRTKNTFFFFSVPCNFLHRCRVAVEKFIATLDKVEKNAHFNTIATINCLFEDQWCDIAGVCVCMRVRLYAHVLFVYISRCSGFSSSSLIYLLRTHLFNNRYNDFSSNTFIFFCSSWLRIGRTVVRNLNSPSYKIHFPCFLFMIYESI